MDYQIGETGRVVVVRFSDGDDLLGGLAVLARKEYIRAAVIHLVGGIRRGKFVVGPRGEEMPPEPVWRELEESHEMLGVGTLFWEGDEPKVHIHGSFGKHDFVKTGCLRDDSEVFLVLEAIVTEVRGVSAVRQLDPVSGLSLLKLRNDDHAAA
ncbi:PPC domain-containing DNA-binding protein [Geobacter sp. DSM 9736]|uniref:PPC domain-containing DNA-binding protein n=1 Tax=Geobacter sp. DSM 9736 TaxID=1277350 RepID=UPI000B514898|nr:PPC domain-containing DNA-binding protein [Geobacter sp. DSM 9736]SNB45150.1 Predicted DNA-binding protein with PD1-like DNA-binding motif [Geobacter sp. DSM 9736]